MSGHLIEEERIPSKGEKILRGVEKLNGRFGLTIDFMGKEIFIGVVVSKVEPHIVYKKQQKTLTVPVGKTRVMNL